MISSPVKGLRPGRALVALLLCTVIFASPGRVKAPAERFLRCRYEEAGTIPRRRHLGPRTVRWLEHEVHEAILANQAP